MTSTDACRDLTIGALTDAESQTAATHDSFLPAVMQTLLDRGHHALTSTLDTPDGSWTAVTCNTSDGYVVRTYGPYSGFNEQWNEEPVHISRHNAVEKFLRYLRNAPRKPLLDHLDTTTAYRELFADEYRATCAVVVAGWWQARMSEGHTPESAQMLLALAVPPVVSRHLTFPTDGSPPSLNFIPAATPAATPAVIPDASGGRS